MVVGGDGPQLNQICPQITGRKDLSHLDRNIDALVQDLTKRCQQVFDRAASAAARKAIVDPSLHSIARPIEKKRSEGSDAVRPAPLVRTRAECDTSAVSFRKCVFHLLILFFPSHKSLLSIWLYDFQEKKPPLRTAIFVSMDFLQWFIHLSDLNLFSLHGAIFILP